MPANYTYPGVYVEEIPSGVRTITGVSTSVTAFIGYFKRGPMNKAVRIFNMGDFEREFGGLEAKSEASYAIQQFFLNGGSEAWVVRVASEKPNKPVAAEVIISDSSRPQQAAALTVRAINAGEWGNNLRVGVDNSSLVAGEFNLTVTEVTTVGGQTVPAQPPEIFRNLSMNRSKTNFVETVINDPNTGSKLVQVEAKDTNPPLMNGTLSGKQRRASEVMVEIPETPVIMVAIGSDGKSEGKEARMTFPPNIALPASLPLRTVATALQSAIRAAAPENRAFAAATVQVIDGKGYQQLRILAGPGETSNRIEFKIYSGNTTATELGLTKAAKAALVIATLSGKHDSTVPKITNTDKKLKVKVDGTAIEKEITLAPPTVNTPKLEHIANSLQNAIRQIDSKTFKKSLVTIVDSQLVVLPGETGQKLVFKEYKADAQTDPDPTATNLKLKTSEVTHKMVTLSEEHTEGPNIPKSPKVSVTGEVTRDVSLSTLTNPSSFKTVASSLQNSIQTAGQRNTDSILKNTKVFVVDKRLVVLPGGNTTATTAVKMTFANTNRNIKTADKLKLTSSQNAIPATATLSGEHPSDNVSFLAAPVIEVRFGAISRTAKLNLSKGRSKLSEVASSLQKAIREAEPDLTAFSQASVKVVDNKQLVVLPGGNSLAAMIFANVSPSTSATEMKLTNNATKVTAMRSGSHDRAPELLGSLAVKVSVSHKIELDLEAALLPLETVAEKLQKAIRGAPSDDAFKNATVSVIDDRLAIFPGRDANYHFSFANADASKVAKTLQLTSNPSATVNVQEYTLGKGQVSNSAQMGGTKGEGGTPPGGNELNQGIKALDKVPLFNLLCIPRAACINGADSLSPTEAKSVLTKAEQYCAERRAFFLMDTPTGIDNLPEIEQMLPNLPKDKNAALYYPRVQIPDPLNNFRLRSVGASGTIAGMIARTDSERGVWKAPAGIEATLKNVSKLDDVLSDPENGVLNPLGVNCLRTFPIYGTVCWGARTLDGSDQKASEWKYIPVRRLALYIEESLFRGLKWVVFEPNDEPLWAQIRLNVGAFMQNLFRQGAFQGKSPREAYFVKCDRETTTQNDINLGIVNIIVGFAPLKPAEFVIIKLQQMAGQIAT